MNAAHLHLMLNHVPVLGGLGTLLLFGVVALKHNPAIAKLTLQFMVLIGIVSLAAFFTGEPAEELIEHLPGVSESLIERHEQFALYSLVTTEMLAAIGMIGIVLMRKGPEPIKKYWTSIGALAFLNAGLMLATANYGGEIRHTEIRKADPTVPGVQQPAADSERDESE